MKEKEKMLWLYDKLDELTGIIYDICRIIEIDCSEIKKAVKELYYEFNAFQRLKMKLEGD